MYSILFLFTFPLRHHLHQPTSQWLLHHRPQHNDSDHSPIFPIPGVYVYLQSSLTSFFQSYSNCSRYSDQEKPNYIRCIERKKKNQTKEQNGNITYTYQFARPAISFALTTAIVRSTTALNSSRSSILSYVVKNFIFCFLLCQGRSFNDSVNKI